MRERGGEKERKKKIVRGRKIEIRKESDEIKARERKYLERERERRKEGERE